MGGQDRKVGRFALRGRAYGRSDGWSGGFESDPQEDHFLPGIFLGQFKGVEGGVNHPDIGPAPFLPLKGRLTPRHPEHIPEGGDDHPFRPCKFDRTVHLFHGRHTNGASRSRHQVETFGEETADPVPENGHGVRAADLHETHGPCQCFPDLSGQRLCDGPISIFVDILHLFLSLAPFFGSSHACGPGSLLIVSQAGAYSYRRGITPG